MSNSQQNQSQEADRGRVPGLSQGYFPPGPFDEMLDNRGAYRSGWERFAAGIDGLRGNGLAQRGDQVRRLLRENGVTYNVYGASPSAGRPWELDPLPLLFAPQQWQELSDGLAQRARLLDRIAADVYGPQTLLYRGLLPPELIFGHTGFLLPCHGLKPPHDTYLHLYAAHLVRDADGRWLTLADRTQGPSGAGYAIENRLIISRTLPDEFHNLYVERLAGFFMQLRETLWSMSPRPADQPRVVLLSPGLRSGTYFEDSYLARYLGYTLVEGADLTVRDTSVYLKTLGGLLPVDVILRRIADEDSDPLELRSDGWLGVPGLVQAVRSGQVAVANALGSGWLEAPALMAFLPAICQHLLGEPLKLPSVPTWWCGDAESLRFVESNLEQLVIRPAILHRTSRPVFCGDLSESERTGLLARIRAQPGQFVAQTRVNRSTTPVWNSGAVQPWYVGLRAFAVANGDRYSVMPGGLSRVSSSPSGLGESMAAGQGSKDVWVLSDRPVAPVSLLSRTHGTIELQRTGNDLPSRVAENVYWLGRHLERSEAIVRHLRSIVVRLLSEIDVAKQPEIGRLLQALLRSGDKSFEPLHEPADSWTSMRSKCLDTVFDGARGGTLLHSLKAVQRSAASIRDRLSNDSWRIINQLDLEVLFPWPREKARFGEVLLLLDQVLSTLLAISGLTNENMTRGPGWRFLELGRRIERATKMLTLLRRTLVPSCADLAPLLEVLLEIGDSTMTYRNRYLTSVQLSPTLDLLVLDETNPRAIAFQIKSLSEHVNELRLVSDRGQDRSERELVYETQRVLRLIDTDGLAEIDPHGRRALLDNFLVATGVKLAALSDHLTAAYFTHAVPSRQLGSWRPGGEAS